MKVCAFVYNDSVFNCSNDYVNNTDHIGNQYKLWIFMFTLSLIQSLLQTSKANFAAVACLIHQDVLQADCLTVISS